MVIGLCQLVHDDEKKERYWFPRVAGDDDDALKKLWYARSRRRAKLTRGGAAPSTCDWLASLLSEASVYDLAAAAWESESPRGHEDTERLLRAALILLIDEAAGDLLRALWRQTDRDDEATIDGAERAVRLALWRLLGIPADSWDTPAAAKPKGRLRDAPVPKTATRRLRDAAVPPPEPAKKKPQRKGDTGANKK